MVNTRSSPRLKKPNILYQIVRFNLENMFFTIPERKGLSDNWAIMSTLFIFEYSDY